MTPEIRAAADRFILDSANLRYLASLVPKGGLERDVPALGWNVRQTIGHLVICQERYAYRLQGILDGAAMLAAADRPADNRATADEVQRTPLPELLGRLDLSLARIVAQLQQLAPGAGDLDVGGVRLGERLGMWSRHPAEHAMDLVDALPEIRFDPMMLNWVLYADYSEDQRRTQRQVALLADVRERFSEKHEDDE